MNLPLIETFYLAPDGATNLATSVTLNVLGSPSPTIQGSMALTDGATSAFVVERSIDGMTYQRVGQPYKMDSSSQSVVVGLTNINAPLLKIRADAANVGSYDATVAVYRFN